MTLLLFRSSRSTAINKLPLSNFAMSTSAPTADTPSYVTADFSLVPVSLPLQKARPSHMPTTDLMIKREIIRLDHRLHPLPMKLQVSSGLSESQEWRIRCMPLEHVLVSNPQLFFTRIRSRRYVDDRTYQIQWLMVTSRGTMGSCYAADRYCTYLCASQWYTKDSDWCSNADKVWFDIRFKSCVE